MTSLRRTGDEGITLVEVTVTMGVMGVLLAVFTGAILQVYRSVNATEALSTAQSQLQNAFRRLDKEIRYASWVAAPSAVAPYYVEFALPPDADGDVQCRQLRLDGAVLQLLQWEAGAMPLHRPYQVLAWSLVANDPDPDATVGRRPFVLHLPGSRPYAPATPDATAVGTSFSSEFYRMRIRLTTRVVNRVLRSDVTFTAVNTSRGTVSQPSNPCSEGRPSP